MQQQRCFTTRFTTKTVTRSYVKTPPVTIYIKLLLKDENLNHWRTLLLDILTESLRKEVFLSLCHVRHQLGSAVMNERRMWMVKFLCSCKSFKERKIKPGVTIPLQCLTTWMKLRVITKYLWITSWRFQLETHASTMRSSTRWLQTHTNVSLPWSSTLTL